MKRIAFAMVTILLPLSFAGCGAAPGHPEPVDKESGTIPEQIEPAFQVGLSEVYYVRYNDGTRCVIVDRDNGGAGVDCDW